jgi:chromosomal replication initiation ATPase DnaA
MHQLPLDLRFMPAQGRDDFIISDCNRLAAEWIDRWPDWPGQFPVLNIVGPAASGKSHLAAVWQAGSNAKILMPDDAVDALSGNIILDHPQQASNTREEGLFHCFNALAASGRSMLILSRTPVARMDWQLADLASRMRSVNLVQLDGPDDALLRALLEKYFADRQLAVGPAVLDYIVARIERSFAAVQIIAAEMDRQSLAQQRSLTMPLAREIMDRFADGTLGRQPSLPQITDPA